MEVFSTIKCKKDINSTIVKDVYVTRPSLQNYPSRMVYLYSSGYIKALDKLACYLMYLTASFCAKNTVDNAKFLLYFLITGYTNLIISSSYFTVSLEHRHGSKCSYRLLDHQMYIETTIIIGNNCSLLENFLCPKIDYLI